MPYVSLNNIKPDDQPFAILIVKCKGELDTISVGQAIIEMEEQEADWANFNIFGKDRSPKFKTEPIRKFLRYYGNEAFKNKVTEVFEQHKADIKGVTELSFGNI